MGEAILHHQPAMKMLKQSFAEMVDRLDTGEHSKKIVKYVGVIPNAVIVKLQMPGKALQTAVIAMRDDDIAHALRDSKQAKGIYLSADFWKHLPYHLRNPDAILLQHDKGSHNLLFVFSTEQGKVVVKMDYEIRVKDKLGKRKVKVNVGADGKYY